MLFVVDTPQDRGSSWLQRPARTSRGRKHFNGLDIARSKSVRDGRKVVPPRVLLKRRLHVMGRCFLGV